MISYYFSMCSSNDTPYTVHSNMGSLGTLQDLLTSWDHQSQRQTHYDRKKSMVDPYRGQESTHPKIFRFA